MPEAVEEAIPEVVGEQVPVPAPVLPPPPVLVPPPPVALVPPQPGAWWEQIPPPPEGWPWDEEAVRRWVGVWLLLHRPRPNSVPTSCRRP